MVNILKKLLVMVAAVAGLATLVGCDEDRRISENKLPGAAREFISQYFPGASVLYAEKDRDDRIVSYNVRLSDGTELDFNESGEWTSVDCNFNAVPAGIVPAPILAHLETYVPGGTDVFKIEKAWGGYEIEIRDGRDLIYDSNGNFVREDR